MFEFTVPASAQDATFWDMVDRGYIEVFEDFVDSELEMLED